MKRERSRKDAGGAQFWEANDKEDAEHQVRACAPPWRIERRKRGEARAVRGNCEKKKEEIGTEQQRPLASS